LQCIELVKHVNTDVHFASDIVNQTVNQSINQSIVYFRKQNKCCNINFNTNQYKSISTNRWIVVLWCAKASRRQHDIRNYTRFIEAKPLSVYTMPTFTVAVLALSDNGENN